MYVDESNTDIFSRLERHHIISYGGDISIDFNLFRMPDAATTSLTLSVYQPMVVTKHKSDNDRRKPFITVGFGLPF